MLVLLACLQSVVAHGTDLGVSFDDRLSLSPDVSQIVAKSPVLKPVLKCLRSRDYQLLVRAFCSFVWSLLELF
jgi:hypothetical protein